MTDMMRKEDNNFEALEQVLADGNLQALTAEQRCLYVQKICTSIGVNPITRPFQFIRFQGKVVLYATKVCTDQLRKLHGVSIIIKSIETEENGLMTVHAQATDSAGRTDEDIGVIDCLKMRGADLVNARMKAVTKAKRRVTLSICGLSVLDESELGTMPSHETLHTPVPAQAPAPVEVEGRSAVDPKDAIRAIKAKIEEGRPKVKPKPVAVAPKKAAPKKVAPETVEAVVSASSVSSFEYEPIPEIPGGVS